MSEEKKEINKKEMTDEELDKVAGGFEMWRAEYWDETSYKFTEKETKKLLARGFEFQPNYTYTIDRVIVNLHLTSQLHEIVVCNKYSSVTEVWEAIEEMVERTLKDLLSE